MKGFVYRLYRALPPRIRWFISYLTTAKFVVGMIVFVVDGEKLLLLKHSYQDKWALPGGWLKHGEDIFTSVEREMKEEIAVEVEVTGVFSVRTVKTSPVIDIALIARIRSGRIKADGQEVLDAAFFPLSGLPADILSTHAPYVREFVREHTRR